MRVWAHVAAVVLTCQLGACGSRSAPSEGGTGGPAPQWPLVQSGQLVWDGAFRLPKGSFGMANATFGYGGWALGYNAASGGLYVVGHDYGQLVAEVTIPAVSPSVTVLASLPTATLLQPFADPTAGQKSEIGGYPNWKTGGLLVYGGRLIASYWSYFDSGGAATHSHFTHSLTLAAPGTVTGAHKLGPLKAGFYGGFMATVPAVWQASLGGPALTGQCCIPIITRTSFGPAAHAFDPAQLGVAPEPISTEALVYYPETHTQPDGQWNSSNTNFFNGTTQMAGMVIPAGTRSLLFVGRQGTGKFCYRCADPDPYCSAFDIRAPPYRVQVWAYDLNDLANVKAGTLAAWDVRPYSIWTLTGNLAPNLPFFDGCMHVKGLAYDAATQRVWIASYHPDGDNPIIHQFHVNTASGTGSGTVTVGAPDDAFNVIPSQPASGTGSITVTATNSSCVSSTRASGCVSATAPWDRPEPVEIFTTQDGVRVGVQVLATRLASPWALAFAPDGRLFVTERPGRVRVLQNGMLLAQPVLTLTDEFTTGESGLLGLALHPSFASNHLLYLVYASAGRNGTVGRLVRYREVAGTLGEAAVLLDDVPAGNIDNGSRVRFGSDGRLYVTFGAAELSVAQDLASLNGKILRLADDGTTPGDNPFGSPVWSWGHRSPQGFDWHPVTGDLFVSERGWRGYDEINVIDRGKDYGRTTIEGSKTGSGLETRLHLSPSVEPSGASFYRGSAFPAFRNDLFVAALRGEALLRVRLDTANPRHVVSVERLLKNRFGQLRDVVNGPDGLLYVVTNNRDTGGAPPADDGRILRLVPLDP